MGGWTKTVDGVRELSLSSNAQKNQMKDITIKSKWLVGQKGKALNRFREVKIIAASVIGFHAFYKEGGGERCTIKKFREKLFKIKIIAAPVIGSPTFCKGGGE